MPIQAGEKLIMERMDEVKRRLMPVNYDQAIDAARLLEIPFFSAHTPTDNLVVDYLNTYFAKKKPTLIEDVQKALARASPSTASPHRRAPARTSARAAPARGPARCGST